jgi:ribosomal protein S18 acetylase RimI-like enzyme
MHSTENGKNTAELTNQRASLPDTVIREADRQDAELLVELGKHAFYEAFAEQTAAEDMAAYLQTTFSIEKIKTQLNNKDSLYLILELQADPVGYTYLYPTQPPGCIKAPKAIQLIRFYLLKNCYGLGVGNTLMQTCLDESHVRGYRSVWLSSWELNGRANAFYKKWHFKIVGRQKFVVGSDVQNDFIFMRDL